MDRRRVLKSVAAGAATTLVPGMSSGRVPLPPGPHCRFRRRGFNDILAAWSATNFDPAERGVSSRTRPGAGVLGSETVARAAPDGYAADRLVSARDRRRLSQRPVIRPGRRFRTDHDRATAPNVMVVHPGLPVNSVAELVAYAKANPGKLSYASNSIGKLASRDGAFAEGGQT